MPKYDCLFLLSASFADTELPSLIEDIKKMLSEVAAQDIKLENIGRQKLAYPIGLAHFAYFLNSCFSLPGEKVKVLKEKFSLEPMVIRFMLTHHQEKERPRRLVVPLSEREKRPVRPKAASVDLKEIDKKIDEILQQDNIVV